MSDRRLESKSDNREPTAVELTELLVAYLDGELDEASRAEVARRVEEDPPCRQQLAELEKSFAMLEELPQAIPGVDFARTTVETIAVSVERDQHASRDAHRRGRWLSLAFALASSVAGLALGYVGTRALLPDPDAELLRDLPVVEHLERYLYADDIDFLRRLQSEDLFSPEETDEN